MKRFIITVIALILAFSLVACTQPTTCQHVDEDGDEKCDNCSADVPKEEPEHTECIDENKDSKCDDCGEPVSPSNSYGGDTECNHIDSDGNGFCDDCGAVFTPIIPLPF